MNERKYRIEGHQLLKKDSSVPIPDDEPVFILRAKDRHSLTAIYGYAMLCQNLQHRKEVMKSVEDFRQFQDQFPDKIKEPDA